jgi:hypothetical protein
MLPLLHRRHVLALAASLALGLSACDDSSSGLSIPAAPTGLGQVDSAPVQDEASVLPFVDHAATNVRGDACHATVATNAGVRVLQGFLDLWTPATLLVDAGVSADASGDCPAITAYTGNGMDGTVRRQSVLDASLQYVVDTTAARTADEAAASYYDDRRGKGYSVTDGLGPLTDAWRTAAQQTTTITSIPADATSVKYDDGGNNTGVGSSGGNTTFGTVVDFVNNVGANASTEPPSASTSSPGPGAGAPACWSPTLVPAESSNAATDGGFPSGHTAEAVRDTLAMAYVMPERFQELVARGLELGRNRIVAGMHSPLDVIGGRILGTASAVGNLATASAGRAAAYAHPQRADGRHRQHRLDELLRLRPSGSSSTDRFADTAAMKATAIQRLTYGFQPIADTTQTARCPRAPRCCWKPACPTSAPTSAGSCSRPPRWPRATR